MGIPHAIVFGNHDTLCKGDGCTRQQLMTLDRSLPLSYSQAGPPSVSGLSNYYLDILPSNGTAAAQRLWFLGQPFFFFLFAFSLMTKRRFQRQWLPGLDRMGLRVA